MKRTIVFLVGCLYILSVGAQEVPTGIVILESHLPIVSIQTHSQEIPDEPKIYASMEIIDNDSSSLNKLLITGHQYAYHIGIEIRGESSQWFYPKKSYGIETRDSLGDNLNISLFGLPKENDWILYGPYGDKTLIRNKLSYDLAGQLMEWAPTLLFCELVIDNEYQGVYLFGEKIKRDKNRVAIAKCVEKDTVGNDLTGGYIIRIDKGPQEAYYGWYSDHRTQPQNGHVFFQYYYPKKEKILDRQKEYIQNYIQGFEDCLASELFDHPNLGYSSYIDVQSFVDYFIINELTKNIDGYRLSTYLYKDKDRNGGKLKIGPVWDYNLSFGNANYCDGQDHTGWGYQFNRICPSDMWAIPFWWDRLLEDPHFKNQIKTRWYELRSGPLHQDSILNRIEQYQTVLGDAINRNFNEWPILGEWVWPNHYVGRSYYDEITELKRWISSRLVWLDTYMPGQRITSGSTLIAGGTKALVFPNPFQEVLNISFFQQPVDRIELIIYELTGRIIDTYRIRSTTTHLEMDHLPPGMYFYQIKEKGLLLDHGKLMKQ